MTKGNLDNPLKLDATLPVEHEAFVEQLADKYDLKVAVVEGDNLMPQLKELCEADIRDMTYNMPLPERVLAMNAYLGAFPIAAALDGGTDVVITG